MENKLTLMPTTLISMVDEEKKNNDYFKCILHRRGTLQAYYTASWI